MPDQAAKLRGCGVAKSRRETATRLEVRSCLTRPDQAGAASRVRNSTTTSITSRLSLLVA